MLTEIISDLEEKFFNYGKETERFLGKLEW